MKKGTELEKSSDSQWTWKMINCTTFIGSIYIALAGKLSQQAYFLEKSVGFY